MGYLSLYQEAKPHTYTLKETISLDLLCREVFALPLSPTARPMGWCERSDQQISKEASEQVREHMSCISG